MASDCVPQLATENRWRVAIGNERGRGGAEARRRSIDCSLPACLDFRGSQLECSATLRAPRTHCRMVYAAFRHLDQFQGRSQFTTWMHTIEINSAKSKLRRQRARPLFFSLDQSTTDEGFALAETLADPHSSLDDTYSDVERSRILKTIVSELPEKLRCVVVLCDIEGVRLKEAAARLGLTVSAVKSWRSRANRLLLKMAKQACARARSNSYIRETIRRPQHPFRRGLGRGEPEEAIETKTGEVQNDNDPMKRLDVAC